MKKPRAKLPRKLSKLLKISLDDLETINANPGYVADSVNWHHPVDAGRIARTPELKGQKVANNPCLVCQAGAVMVQRFDAKPGKTLAPASLAISEKDQMALRAIDAMRNGNFKMAAARLDIKIELPEEIEKIEKIEALYNKLFADDRPTRIGHFLGKAEAGSHIATMRKLVPALEKQGL